MPDGYCPFPDNGGYDADEQLIDTLIAISVVAKRVAEKLRRERAAGCAGCDDGAD